MRGCVHCRTAQQQRIDLADPRPCQLISIQPPIQFALLDFVAAMPNSSNLHALEARMLILDVHGPSHPHPIVTMISIWESLRSRPRAVTLSWDVQEKLMTRGKQVVNKMHLHASQLMELYGEQYVLVETDHENGISIRFHTTRWDWRLGGRKAWIETSDGGEEGEVSTIKWQVVVEKL